jgi:hypothetical protein
MGCSPKERFTIWICEMFGHKTDIQNAWHFNDGVTFRRW